MPRHKSFADPVKRPEHTKSRPMPSLPIIAPHIIEAAVESISGVDMVLMSMPKVVGDPRIKHAQYLLCASLHRYGKLSRRKIGARVGMVDAFVQSALAVFDKRTNWRDARHYRPEWKKQLEDVYYLVKKLHAMEQRDKPCFFGVRR